MAGLSDFACDGTLVIGGVSMNRPAWMVGGDQDGDGTLFDLVFALEQRGEDRILPNATGVIPYRRRKTVTPVEVRLLVVGDVDQAGSPVADHTVGLFDNLQYLMANVVTPVATSAGTRAATYTPPDGVALTADVHVTGLRRDNMALGTNAIWEGRLLVSIPAGQFT